MNIDSILVIFFLLSSLMCAGQMCNCPLEGGEVKKTDKQVILGEGNLKSISIANPLGKPDVFSIINGEVIKVDQIKGILEIQNDSIMVRYFGLKINSEIEKGVTVKKRIVLGTIDTQMGFIRLDFYSKDTEYIYNFMSRICSKSPISPSLSE